MSDVALSFKPTISSIGDVATSPIYPSIKMAYTSSYIVAAAALAGMTARSTTARSFAMKTLQYTHQRSEIFLKMTKLSQNSALATKDMKCTGALSYMKTSVQEKKKIYTLSCGMAEHVVRAVHSMKEMTKQSCNTYMSYIHMSAKNSSEFIQNNPTLCSTVFGAIVESGVAASLQNAYGNTESEIALHEAFKNESKNLDNKAIEIYDSLYASMEKIQADIAACLATLEKTQLPSQQKEVVQKNLLRLKKMIETAVENEATAIESLQLHIREIGTYADQKKKEVETSGLKKEFIRQAGLSLTYEAISIGLSKYSSYAFIPAFVAAVGVAAIDSVTHTDATFMKTGEYKKRAVSEQALAISSKDPSHSFNKNSISIFDSNEDIATRSIFAFLKSTLSGSYAGKIRSTFVATSRTVLQDIAVQNLPKGQAKTLAQQTLHSLDVNLDIHHSNMASSIKYYVSSLAAIQNMIRNP